MQGQVCKYSPVCIDCGGQSYIFEPNIYLSYFLRKKYENNHNVKFYQKAVSNRNYKTDYIMLENRILSQGNRIIESLQDGQTKKHISIEVIDLCEFIENEILRQHERIYFLKLDVEGVEFEIIKKIIDKRLYEKIDYIACETHEYMFDNAKEKIAHLRAMIKKYDIKNILLDWV